MEHNQPEITAPSGVQRYRIRVRKHPKTEGVLLEFQSQKDGIWYDFGGANITNERLEADGVACYEIEDGLIQSVYNMGTEEADLSYDNRMLGGLARVKEEGEEEDEDDGA